MFIDIHAHSSYFPLPKRATGEQAFATPQQLIEIYDEVGIEKAVLLPIIHPETTYGPQSNQEVIHIICKKWPDRFIPFCNIDPRAMTNSPKADLDSYVEFYKNEGCKGVGEMCSNLAFDDPRTENLFKAVEAGGIPLLFHMATTMDGGDYGLYDEPGMPLLEKALQKFPKLIFLAHSQPFWAEMTPLRQVTDRAIYPEGPINQEGRVQELLRKYPNLHCDLSAGSGFNAISRDLEYGPKFLEEFQDRLYFGTDICAPGTMPGLADHLQKLRAEKKISEACFWKIARENAIKLLKLEDS